MSWVKNSPNIEGIKFGRLTPLQRTYDEHGRGVWWCKCDCGNHVLLNFTEIKTRLSCGCVPFSLIDLRGSVFGMLTVLDHLGKDVWKCQCACGRPPVALSARKLISGSVVDCGCKTRASRRVARAVPGQTSANANDIRALHISLIKENRESIARFSLNPSWRDEEDFSVFLEEITGEIGPPPPNAVQPLRLVQIDPARKFMGPTNIRWALRGLDDK